MSLRLTCPACRASFLTTDDRLGRTVRCPKCGAEQVAAADRPTLVPPTLPAAVGHPESPEDAEPASGRGRRWLVFGLAALLPIVGVGLLVARPLLNRPRPEGARTAPALPHAVALDPVEAVANEFLEDLARGDLQAARRVSAVAEPPAIRSFERPRRDPRRSETVRGSFAPIGELHARIQKEFTFDPQTGRYQTRNPLGPAAETLDALHAAKEKFEREGVYEKMGSADLDEVVDGVTAFGSVFNKLAEGALTPQRLVPTYAQLVKEVKLPLPGPQEALARDYADHPATWDALLGRPFATLEADGPFILERAEVTARVHDRLASAGDPPSLLRLTLTRFRLEAIDTGWKVTAARRQTSEPEPASAGPPQRSGSSHEPDDDSRRYTNP